MSKPIQISDTYNLPYNNTTYKGIRDDIYERLNNANNLEGTIDVITHYVAICPFEDVYSEHLLVTVRRYIISHIEENRIDIEQCVHQISEEYYFKCVVEKYIDSNNFVLKELRKIKYEIARLLAEAGYFIDANILFELILSHIRNQDRQDYIHTMALNGHAVSMQNMGLLQDAYNALDDINLESNCLSDIDYKNCSYFTFKHRATLYRRMKLNPLDDESMYAEEKKRQIEREFEQSGQDFETYNVCFSKGFFYYFIDNNTKALECYQRCQELLGAFTDEYYLIHFNLFITKLSLINSGMLTAAEERQYKRELKVHLENYKKSIECFKNFKYKVTDLLYDVYDQFNSYHSQDDQVKDIEKSLKDINLTPEVFYCMKKDVFEIIKRFDNTDNGAVYGYFTRKYGEFELENKRKNQLLNEELVTSKENGVAVCFDFRGFTLLSTENLKKSSNALRKLQASIKEYLFNEFNDINSTGDGYIIIKQISGADIKKKNTEYICNILPKIFQIINMFSLRYKNLKIGVGISCGKVYKYSYGKNVTQFIGPAANHASRMSDVAKPYGIAISVNNGDNYNTENKNHINVKSILQNYSFKKISISGKNIGEKFDAIISNHVNEWCYSYKYNFKYIYPSNNEFDKRIFLNYGKACEMECSYCISNNEQFNEFKIADFIEEFNTINNCRNINDYLISLGCMNETLDNNNFDTTLEIVCYLLKRIVNFDLNNVIQLATKEKPSTIRKFFEKIEKKLKLDENTKQRLIILYSVATIEYSNKLESRPINNDDLDELLQLKKDGYPIIPYVKPFLPEITDRDDKLIDFLNNNAWDILIIGNSYINHAILSNMAIFCHENNIENIEFYRNASILGNHDSKLEHPNYFGNKLFTPNYSKKLDGFISKFENKNIFKSSPCAISYMNKKTSFTHIGSKDMGRYELCGKEDCINEFCIYNIENQTDLIEYIIQKLKMKYDNILDKSHSLQHFISVLRIARKIVKEINEVISEEDKELLYIACLLHDIGDIKIVNKDERNKRIKDFLKDNNFIDNKKIDMICKIVTTSSYEDYVIEKDRDLRLKKIPKNIKLLSNILFDADKIDAIGAMGIARCFSFPKNRGIYNLQEHPRTLNEIKTAFEDDYSEEIFYRSSVTHFFEKIIHLYDSLILEESKIIAKKRNSYTDNFVCQFLKELNESSDKMGKERIKELKKLVKNKDWFRIK